MDLAPHTRYVIELATVGAATPPEAIRAHVAYLRALDQAGKLELCGPFTDGRGGMVIVRASGAAEADEIARNDPFVAGGWRTHTIREWLLSCEANQHLGYG